MSWSGLEEAFSLLSFLLNSYEKKINSSFLTAKVNRSADYDKNIANTGLFGGHNLLLCYMNLCENIFLYLSHKNTYIVIIHVTSIFET